MVHPSHVLNPNLAHFSPVDFKYIPLFIFSLLNDVYYIPYVPTFFARRNNSMCMICFSFSYAVCCVGVCPYPHAK